MRKLVHEPSGLRRLLGDRLLCPGDVGYDGARQIWNGMHDRRPAGIARCLTATEVGAVLRYSRAEGLAVTVRGGGHNVAGTSVADGAMMIDLSLMRDVTVDPGRRQAHAQGGCLLRDLDAATVPHGLACPSGVVSHTGLGGLTLGGGYGWLARRWGLTCDHLISAEVVLADGSIVEAIEGRNDDLLWALRGGGGNFGIVTRFTLRLRPVGPMVHRRSVYPLEAAGEALAAYRRFAARQPRDLHTVGAFTVAGTDDWIPTRLHRKPALFITAVWLGESTDGWDEALTAPEVVPVSATGARAITYAELQALGDHSEPAGHRYFTKSCYLADVPPGSVERIVASAGDMRSDRSSIDFEYLGGAIGDRPDGESAFPRRDAPYIYTASAQWTDPARDEENTAWARNSVDRLEPWHHGGAYVNYVQEPSPAGSVSLYGEDRHRRLGAVKSRYDPENVFRHNQNVVPSVSGYSR